MRKFLLKLHTNIKHRVNNPSDPKKRKHYKGLYLMCKYVFMQYETDPTFVSLYETWIESGKQRRLVPTLDRLNPNLGYSLDNVEWVTLSVNSKRIRFENRTTRHLPVGVRLSKAKHMIRYEARARDNYKYIHLGTFDTVKEARDKYLQFKTEKDERGGI